jgi:hypothetical protein
MCLDIRFINSRRSNFPSSNSNVTLAEYRILCNIPYDEYHCSILSNKTSNSIRCIIDTEAMTAHILPLVSYVLQLYLIYELVSFTGKYSHILTDMFWIVALVIFIIIAIGVHGSSCFHSVTSVVICMIGMAMFGFVISLMIFSGDLYSSNKRRNTYRHQRLLKTNHDREVLSTVIVSWIWLNVRIFLYDISARILSKLVVECSFSFVQSNA